MSSKSAKIGNSLAEPADAARRGWIAAVLAAVALVAVSVSRWIGFIYPIYAEAVIFQCGALALLLIWAWPRRLPVGSWRTLHPAAWLFCAYAAFSVASCAWTPESRLAAIGSLPMFFGVAWALGLGHLLSGRRHVRLIVRAMFAAGTLAALVGLLYVLLSGRTSGSGTSAASRTSSEFSGREAMRWRRCKGTGLFSRRFSCRRSCWGWPIC